MAATLVGTYCALSSSVPERGTGIDGVGALRPLHQTPPSRPVLSVNSPFPQHDFNIYSSIHLIETPLHLAYHLLWQEFLKNNHKNAVFEERQGA